MARKSKSVNASVELKCNACGHRWHEDMSVLREADGSVDYMRIEHILKHRKVCCPRCSYISYKINRVYFN